MAHGIGIIQDPNDESTVLIAAVNHKRTGSVIERFTHKIGSKVAVHVETIKNDLLTNPNDVVPIDAHRFYATNDLGTTGLLQQYEKFTRRPWGSVVFYNGNEMKIATKGIVYPNGIAQSNNKIYVVSASNRELLIYKRKENDNLKLTDVVDIVIGFNKGILGDNIGVDPISGAIYVTGAQKIIPLMKHVEKGTDSPSIVVKITNNTAKDLFYGKKYHVQVVYADDGSSLSGATITAIDPVSQKSISSGIFTTGILVCDLQ